MRKKTRRRFDVVSGSIKLCAMFALTLTLGVNAFSQANSYQSLKADDNGVRLHYLKSGTGRTPLILLHGFGDTSRM